MNNIKYKVYIIESQHADDIFENRKEGKILQKSLLLSNIDSSYWNAINQQCFNRAFMEILDAIKQTMEKDSLLTAPIIHISAHGNENGFWLTNKDFIDWKCFSILLDIINFWYYERKPSYNLSPIVLCMSVCEGYNGYKMYLDKDISPCSILIGPVKEVSWTDSITAFTTFYHLAIYKDYTPIDSINIMNASAGLNDVFQIITSPEVDKLTNGNNKPKENSCGEKPTDNAVIPNLGLKPS